MADKTKAHTIYKLNDGTRVPGVTTILGILNKPALVSWANRLGLQGIDSSKYVDKMADIGTLAHEMVAAHLRGEECDTSEYSANDIEKAETCVIKYYDWEKEHPIEPVLVEAPLVSGMYRFGGTIDCLAKLNDELVLIDLKTGKAIYGEMFYQLAGYRLLLEGNGYKASGARILRIGRNEDEGFEERVVKNLDKQTKVFLHCLGIYQLQKEIRGEK